MNNYRERLERTLEYLKDVLEDKAPIDSFDYEVIVGDVEEILVPEEESEEEPDEEEIEEADKEVQELIEKFRGLRK